MCGIGAIYTRAPLDCIAEVAFAMARQLRHRGPDHQGIHVASHRRVALSHDRLSIVDLSPLANQPMTNEDRTLWLVCNGEIYNHGDLRPRLEALGHRFHSQGDCEVILHLYEEHGYDLLPYLYGMFAFILYDSVNDVLFCARDRLGKKPLVYAETAQGVALGSEIPAIRHFPGIDVAVDPVALGLYLLRNARHMPEPWTFFRGIRRLRSGHAMLVQHGQVAQIWRYWQPRPQMQETSVDEVRTAFDRAVGRRMVADVEIGALLSGGVDSSGIVQAMAIQGAKHIRTYALGRDRQDEELARARRAASLFGTEHKEFYFDPTRQHEQFETLLRVYGEPIMLLPLLYTYELCQHIRDDGVRVVMAGHGADEVFYGYSGHNDLALLSMFLPFIPQRLRPWLEHLAQWLPPRSRWREALLVAASRQGDRKAQLYRDEARQLWTALLHIDDVDAVVEEAVGEWFGTWFGDHPPPDYIDEAGMIGLMHENCHSVTIAGDLPAMAASVEVRCPFLDQELVELGWSIPYWQKIKRIRDHRQNKWILKKALEGRVPRDLLYAPKRGFGYHIQEEDVLRGPWKGAVDRAFATMDDLGGLLKCDAIVELKKDFDAGGSIPAMLIAKLYAIFLYSRIAGN
jgi:asparagine synthase (glutamine-hydrolysing)